MHVTEEAVPLAAVARVQHLGRLVDRGLEALVVPVPAIMRRIPELIFDSSERAALARPRLPNHERKRVEEERR